MPNLAEFSLSPQDVAEQLGVRIETVRAWADNGELVSMRTPGKHRRFRQSDVDDFARSLIRGQSA